MAEIMTLKDVAGYLRMNERTIAKLAQEGRLPGFKVASQWRFSKESIDSWLGREMRTGAVATETAARPPKVAALLAADAIVLYLKSRTKDGILTEMTNVLVQAGRITSGPVLLAALREREKLCSTGVGRGIAFLHPRHVISDIAREPVLAFGRSLEGVDFDAVDAARVHFFFLDCAPSDGLHLAMLARLSRLLADDSFLERLRRMQSSEEVIDAVRDAETRLVDAQ